MSKPLLVLLLVASALTLALFGLRFRPPAAASTEPAGVLVAPIPDEAPAEQSPGRQPGPTVLPRDHAEPLDPPSTSHQAPPGAPSLEDVVAAAMPAVASVEAGAARGSGFFVRHDTVITNAHVVAGHATVQLRAGDVTYAARVARIAVATDLALLEVTNARGTQPMLRLGAAAGARVGQEVVAIGSALGVLSNTVTRGIVSAVRRAGEVTLVQTDAAINPGNSGGPLLDRAGRVLGVSTMKAVAGAESIGFAVAAEHVQALLNGSSGSDFGASTPATPLGAMMRQGGSMADDARVQGEAAYARALAAAAQRAGQLDAYWTEYAGPCVSGATNIGERRWLAALDPGAVRLSRNGRIDCGQWLGRITTNARLIDQEIRQANEAARRAGVLPGVLRNIRRQHRLDWPGWN